MVSQDLRDQRVMLVLLAPRETEVCRVILVRMVDQAHFVALLVSLDLRATRVTAVSLALSACKDLVVPRDRMVRMASLALLALPAQRVTKAQLVPVAHQETSDLVVPRETRETLAHLAFPDPLVIVAQRAFLVTLVLLARLASVDLSVPRETPVPSVLLAAWD